MYDACIIHLHYYVIKNYICKNTMFLFLLSGVD